MRLRHTEHECARFDGAYGGYLLNKTVIFLSSFSKWSMAIWYSFSKCLMVIWYSLAQRLADRVALSSGF